MLRFLTLSISFSLFFAISSLQAQAPQPPQGPQPTLPILPLEIGGAHINAEVASTPEQLETGLMFRPKLGDNDGMIFVLGQEERATFWMQNTVIPLSVAYIDRNGHILEVHDMRPLDVSTVPSKSDKIAFALETNQGWFALNKIEPGTQIHPLHGAFGKPPLVVGHPNSVF